MGWSCKEAASVLEISPTKVTQALGPALVKVAKLMLADPLKTLADLQSVMADLERKPGVCAAQISS